MRTKYLVKVLLPVILGSLMLFGCKGSDGSSGTSGANGAAGTDGTNAVAAIEGLRASYPGADDCKECHEPEFETWRESGHGYKMNKIVDGKIPMYPFTQVSAMFPSDGKTVMFNEGLADETTHLMTLANTKYVIGGYGWKARYISEAGIVHGATAQYNFATGAFSAYHNGEGESANVKYNCGYCHTTGWKSTSKGETTATQDDSAGMDGTWDYDAITCQRCHGSNTEDGTAAHIAANKKSLGADTFADRASAQGSTLEFGALTAADKANVVCSDCHVRGSKMTETPVSGGLIRHHEQSTELFGGRHGGASTLGNGIGCVDCHDPHASVKHDAEAKGEGTKTDVIANGNCAVSCHSSGDNAVTVASAYGDQHTCVDCHMPYLVKNAVSSTVAAKQAPGVTALGIAGGKVGDIRSHIFALTDTTDDTFLSATLDSSSDQVKIPVDFSCMTCHGENGTKGPTTAAEAATALAATAIHAAPAKEATLRSAYPGADSCSGSSCHDTEFNKWRESGHGYKMNKIVAGIAPTYPFTDVSAMFPISGKSIKFNEGLSDETIHLMTLATTKYIIGGYGWKARYISDAGIVHGATAQYNFQTGSFSAYHNGDGESANVKYDCGYCHTTGWKSNSKDETTDTQDNSAGMDGTWDFDAITCQRCHGSDTSGTAGHNTKSLGADTFSDRASAQGSTIEFGNLDATDKANVVCSDCHVRGGEMTETPVSGGLIRHHEQSTELFGGRHGDPGDQGNSIGCVDCHDPHASVKHDALAEGEGTKTSVIANGNCTESCHSTKTVNVPYNAGHTCVDCHMPKLVKNAVSTTAGTETVPGVTVLGIPGGKRGDIKSHIFALTATADDTFLSATLDSTSDQVKIPVDYSCMTCHGTGGSMGPTTAAEAVTAIAATPIH